MMSFHIRPINNSDKEWITGLLKEWWAGPKIVTRGKVHMADEYPGFIATKDRQRVGLITYRIDDNECEIASMNSLAEGIGIGSALVEAVKNVAIAQKCERLWLITTNDNIKALKWWKKRRFRQVVTYLNSVEQSRLLKPEIPLTGNDGIPIRDEIELQMKIR
jgi:N-acetylglutamate synthase-like GNAT family acetyltransferase